MKKTNQLLVCIAVFLLTMGSLTGCFLSKPTVNLNDYIEVTAQGYDGYGSIRARVDFDQIVEDYADHLAKKINSEAFGDKTAEMAALYVFEELDPYKLSYEKEEGTKNGDTVKFVWETNESGIKQLEQILRVKFTYEDFVYEVKEMPALREVDPFEYLTLEYSGISGKAVISKCQIEIPIIVNDNESTVRVEAEVDKKEKLSNGDTVKLTIADE